MTPVESLGIAFGLATVAGLNLYLTVLLTGLAVRFDWLSLASQHESLAILGHPWVLGAAATLYVVEFVADKVPYVDSVWDTVHTFIRPIGGVILAAQVLGDLHPALTVIGALLAGTATLSTHASKMGTRALINLSPEPVSNSVASVTEDVAVVGGLGLIAVSPVIALVVSILVATLSWMVARWIWKRVKSLRRSRKEIEPEIAAES